MIVKTNKTGFAVALAWPETFCKQPGSWYDAITHKLGINKDHFYQVGHAALLLIHNKERKCHYYDFGRYHAPFQYGRVRNEITDSGLKVFTRAIISTDGKIIENIDDILMELQQNKECHGDGPLYASYCQINFDKAIQKANALQQKSPIAYGPFLHRGSNCSRFVNDTITAGQPNWNFVFKLRFLVWFTPTPRNNVFALQNRTMIPYLLKAKPFQPASLFDQSFLTSTLRSPDKHEAIPKTAQWLSGEGCGSWFDIKTQSNHHYLISRYSPDGDLECQGIFRIINNQAFDIRSAFQFVHLSHCQKVNIQQDDRLIQFIRIASE